MSGRLDYKGRDQSLSPLPGLSHLAISSPFLLEDPQSRQHHHIGRGLFDGVSGSLLERGDFLQTSLDPLISVGASHRLLPRGLIFGVTVGREDLLSDVEHIVRVAVALVVTDAVKFHVHVLVVGLRFLDSKFNSIQFNFINNRRAPQRKGAPIPHQVDH